MADKIVLVDDSAVARLLLRATLEELGLEVIEAGDGEEAIERLPATGCLAVLTDWYMPKMDGQTLIRSLREAQSDLPIIVITADAKAGLAAMSGGATDYLAKPFDTQAVERKIRELQQRCAAGAE